MLKLFLCCCVLLIGRFSEANFLCAYKCDAKRGRHDALNYTKDVPPLKCLTDCSYTESTAYYCELLYNLALSPAQETIEPLAKKLLDIPKITGQEKSPENNKLYALLRNFNTQKCVNHIKLMSLDLKKKNPAEITQNLTKTLRLFKQVFEKTYPQFKEYHHTCKNKSVNSLSSFIKTKGLFDWCQNYCTPQRIPKTSRSIEGFIKHTAKRNPADLIDLIKSLALKLSHSKNKYMTRFYKCLSQCPVEKTENYICYFMDSINVEKDSTETTRTMLNLAAQIMMRSPVKKGGKETRLDQYLGNTDFQKRCLSVLRKYYYRGENYSKNIAYLQKVYGK